MTSPDLQKRPRTMLYVIRAQKAGTTWLYRQLERHPEVFVPANKEVQYWNSVRSPKIPHPWFKARIVARQSVGPFGLRRLSKRFSPQKLRRIENNLAYVRMFEASPFDLDAYYRYFAEFAGDEAVWADISPGYATLSEPTFAEMSNAHPDARFVFVMRDPAERFVSGLRQKYRRDSQRYNISEDQFNVILEDAIRFGRCQDCYRFSDYQETIRRLDAAVPPEKVLYLFYETLFSEAAMAKLARHLDIAPIAAELKTKVFSGDALKVAVPKDAADRVEEHLASTYRFVRDRFGDEVPAAWRSV